MLEPILTRYPLIEFAQYGRSDRSRYEFRLKDYLDMNLPPFEVKELRFNRE